MEELVNKLAELQAERKKTVDAINNDDEVAEVTTSIEELEHKIAEGHKTLAFLRAGYDTQIDDIDVKMNLVRDAIIDEWDGNKKTLKFGAGSLEFWKTTSVDVKDGGRLLASMSERLPYHKVYDEYIKGFNITAVRKYIGMVEVPEDVVKLVSKTTAKLEQ